MPWLCRHASPTPYDDTWQQNELVLFGYIINKSATWQENKTHALTHNIQSALRVVLVFVFFFVLPDLFLAVVAFPKRCSTWTHFTAALPRQMRPIDLDINRMWFGSVWLWKPGYRRVNIAWFPLSQLGSLARDENHAEYFQFFPLSLSWFDEDTNLLRNYIFRLICSDLRLEIKPSFNSGVKLGRRAPPCQSTTAWLASRPTCRWVFSSSLSACHIVHIFLSNCRAPLSFYSSLNTNLKQLTAGQREKAFFHFFNCKNKFLLLDTGLE